VEANDVMVRLFRTLSTLGLVLLLAACGGAAATATPPPTNTPVPPTATTVPPTATAVPPTNTVAPPTATIVPPTATVAATATRPPATPTTAATATRPAATATRAAAGASPTRPATAGGGGVLVDAANGCQVTLPATFTADAAGGGNATANDDNAFLNLSSFPTEPLGFEPTAQLFIDGFTTAIDDYKEADRQQGTDRGRPFLGVTFTATLVGEPLRGQFYFVQEAGTTCALSVLVKESVASGYGDIIGALVDSVQAVKP
jgi:hypothetical protein